MLLSLGRTLHQSSIHRLRKEPTISLSYDRRRREERAAPSALYQAQGSLPVRGGVASGFENYSAQRAAFAKRTPAQRITGMTSAQLDAQQARMRRETKERLGL
jgi:hypothetical protein